MMSLRQSADAACRLNQRIVDVIRADQSDVDSSYLFHVLEFDVRSTQMRSQHCQGATCQARELSKSSRKLQIPLPPLPEQKRIAGILDAADALRAKRRESLAQLDTLLQSTFLDMFGDPVTNPMGWESRHARRDYASS